MARFGKITGKFLAVAQILALGLLAACGAANVPASVCHATGDPANPYVQIPVDGASWAEHRGHPNDISPVPVHGCPTSTTGVVDGKVAFCHASGDAARPYNKINISVNGLNGHGQHEGDVFPNPDGNCPSGLVANDMITICHATSSQTNPYNEITVSVNGLNGHNGHAGDIIPMPQGGCPTTRQ